MTGDAVPSAEHRLIEMELRLPEPPAPVAAFLPYSVVGTTVYVSGQLATANGRLVATGRLGDTVDLAAGRAAARASAINVLAQLRAAAGGSLDAVARMAKITVFVASTAEFTAQPQVADGASELFIEVFGPAGRHARAAIGVAALPMGTAVEVEAVAELGPAASLTGASDR
jgi:enamine deaminase RidA (YjgF/YER057c/UK114 family)